MSTTTTRRAKAPAAVALAPPALLWISAAFAVGTVCYAFFQVVGWGDSQKEPTTAQVEAQATGSGSRQRPDEKAIASLWSRREAIEPRDASASHPRGRPGQSSADLARAEAQRLLSDLYQIGGGSAVIDEEQARDLKRYLQELAGLGRAAVPAIAEFLDSGQDVGFADLRGGELVGHDSLRTGLIDLLGRLGGPEAVETLARTLGATSEPAEVAALARALQATAPGKYRDALLSAARDSLAIAADLISENGRRSSSRADALDVSPLFDVIRALGTTDLLRELVHEAQDTMPPWKVYSMIALSQLKNGEGVAVLRDALVSEDGGLSQNNLFALQMLGQAAGVDSRAAEALLEVAMEHGNVIPLRDWRKLAWTLRGHSYDFGGDLEGVGQPSPTSSRTGSVSMDANMHSLNLHLRRSASDPARWTRGEVERRIVLIDQLLAASPPAEAAYDLENTRNFILRRASAAGF